MNSSKNRNPVLLVHGINDTGAVFHRMAPYLTQRGWSVYDLDLMPSNGDLRLDELGQQVANSIAATFAPEQHVDLVGFSMGGIVSRYYVQRLGGIDRIQRFITIAAPHHGTWIAYLCDRPGCVQMRPDSTFLQQLNQEAGMLERLNFTSIWTPMDLMIVPANSSQMQVGQNVQVPVLTHAGMITEPMSLDAVVAALSEPLKQNRQFGHSHNSQKSLQRDSNT